MLKRNNARGFTLTEMAISMAIFGILAAIAYPSYLSYTTQSYRSDGHTALLDLAARMEGYYSENMTYVGATIGTGGASDILPSTQSAEGYYVLSITQQNANSYAIQATPVGAHAANDASCGNLTLNQLGVRGITGAGNAADCW